MTNLLQAFLHLLDVLLVNYKLFDPFQMRHECAGLNYVTLTAYYLDKTVIRSLLASKRVLTCARRIIFLC